MITTIQYPSATEIETLIKRPADNNGDLFPTVRAIIDDVKARGDEALRYYNRKFDGTELARIEVDREEWQAIALQLTPSLKKAIDNAIENIRRFHAPQVQDTPPVETSPGVLCWRKAIAIEKVGLYIPAGSAPLFSTLLMLTIPATIAGCKEIIVCTPPGKNGKIHPAILYAAQVTGVSRLFCVGGAQAIAAMVYGTATVPKVYKLFGPGNAYVTAAKMLLNAEGIPIDIPAGPSEVAIIADENCVPAYIAADLLAQAEHGPDSQVLLVTNNNDVIQKVKAALQQQLSVLPRKEIAAQALANSRAVLASTLRECMDIVNAYAPEHLIIATTNADELATLVINAGSVFIGNHTPESAGDYASGTNHTLPTGGHARAYSGVSVDSFVKKITFQKITAEGLATLGPTIEQLAIAEGLQAHANSITIRTTKQLQ